MAPPTSRIPYIHTCLPTAEAMSEECLHCNASLCTPERAVQCQDAEGPAWPKGIMACPLWGVGLENNLISSPSSTALRPLPSPCMPLIQGGKAWMDTDLAHFQNGFTLGICACLLNNKHTTR
jgi:hypothetical protein